MDDKFQPNFDVIRLYDENNPPRPVTKVGVLPFLPARDGGWRVLLMKPRAEEKHLSPPSFQIAKGTRRINMNGSWCDMREDDLRHADPSFWEPLVGTALREGNEEVGVKASNITKLFDMGGFTFTSTTKALVKPLHMFAAEIRDKDDFAPFEHTTAEVSWMGEDDIAKIGRADHAKIVLDIMARLVGEFEGLRG